MKSLGGNPAGARLERIKASPLWAGERFRNAHPIIPGPREAFRDHLAEGGLFRLPALPDYYMPQPYRDR